MSRNSRHPLCNMKNITINPKLVPALNSCSHKAFTVLEFRDSYLKLNEDQKSQDKVAVRKFLYSHMLQLVKRGVLEKQITDGKAKPLYRITDNGKATLLKIGDIKDEGTVNAIRAYDGAHGLHQKLHNYKLEMLSGIGETEEYDAICKELPHMKSQIQELYDDARDRCTKTLGRVKALEAVIAKQKIVQLL